MTDKTVYFARIYSKRQIVYGDLVAVSFGKILNFKHSRHLINLLYMKFTARVND